MTGADVHAFNKAALAPLRVALYDYQSDALQAALKQLFQPDAVVHLATPLEDLDGPQGLYHQAYAPLQQALPDLERRDTIVMAGPSPQGHRWQGRIFCRRRLCSGERLAQYARHHQWRRLARHRPGGPANHHAQPGLLALRKRADS